MASKHSCLKHTASRSTGQAHRDSCHHVLSKMSAVAQGTKTPLKSHSKSHLRAQFREWMLVLPPDSLSLRGSAKASVLINTSSGTTTVVLMGTDSRGWKLLSEQVGHLAFQRLLQSSSCSPGELPCDVPLGCSLVMLPWGAPVVLPHGAQCSKLLEQTGVRRSTEN